MNIWLLRHVKTKENNSGIILGQTDVPPEYELIKEPRIPKTFVSGTVKIYSSTLKRCVVTAQLASQAIYKLSGKLPLVEYCDKLIERGMGVWEGQKK